MKNEINSTSMLGRRLKERKNLKYFGLAILGLILFAAFSGMFNDVITGGAVSGVSLAGLLLLPTNVKLRAPGEDGSGGDLSAEEKALLEKVRKAVNGEIEPTKKEMEKISKTLEKYDILCSEHVELMAQFKALKENPTLGNRIPDLKGQIKSWMDENANAIKAIRGGQKADLTPITIKVASPMTPANTYNGSAYLPQPEFQSAPNEIVRVQPTFWDYLKKGMTNAAAYVWVNKKNPLGAAGFIGPGVAKPGISFEIATEISNAKKIAVSEKCATELLEDIPGMETWITQEIAYQLKQKLNTTLMTGVASSTVPAGIQTISVAYTLTTVKTTNPNNWDAVRACVAQLRSGNLQGVVTAFMNPIDYANMVLTKAVSQGQYVSNPPETGAVIVEDNNIPVGYVQVAILDYYKILVYKDFQIAFGWENDDFTKNLVTTIGEMRIHQFHSENHTGFAIYDTLDNIKTAITEV